MVNMPTDNERLTSFVVLFPGRTGSTYLVEALHSHPQVLALGEWLASMKSQGSTPEDQLEWCRSYLGPRASGEDHGETLISLMRQAPAAFRLDSKIRDWAAVEGPRALGFKTKPIDVLDLDRFTRLIEDLQARIIHLWRRNAIKQAISVARAVHLHRQTSQWNLYQGERPPAIPVKLDWFRHVLKRVEDEQRFLNDYVGQLSTPVCELTYEELLADPVAVFDDLFRFLGVDPAPVEAQSRKNTSDDLREAVTNLSELRAEFVGTVYEQMFDEVLVAGS